MIKIVAALALLLIPMAAQARDWHVVTLDGNACEDMRGLEQESAERGQLPVGSPQGLVEALRMSGAVPEVQTRPMPANNVTVLITWRTRRGDQAARVFFSDIADCLSAVASMIKEGVVPPPGALR